MVFQLKKCGFLHRFPLYLVKVETFLLTHEGFIIVSNNVLSISFQVITARDLETKYKF